MIVRLNFDYTKVHYFCVIVFNYFLVVVDIESYDVKLQNGFRKLVNTVKSDLWNNNRKFYR